MAKNENNESAVALIYNMQSVEEYMMFLNNPPKEDDVKINSQANNSRYVPINYIERKLDELFAGQWSTENFKFQVVVNEIIGQIDLKVFNPVSKTWLTRSGVAAVIIQQNKNSNIDDVTAKIKNTLVKDAPHLKAECIKNAAKSLGVIFGRNLNRGMDDEITPLTEQIENLTETQNKALSDLQKTDLNDTEKKRVERSIRKYTDEAIERRIYPFIKQNTSNHETI